MSFGTRIKTLEESFKKNADLSTHPPKLPERPKIVLYDVDSYGCITAAGGFGENGLPFLIDFWNNCVYATKILTQNASCVDIDVLHAYVKMLQRYTDRENPLLKYLVIPAEWKRSPVSYFRFYSADEHQESILQYFKPQPYLPNDRFVSDAGSVIVFKFDELDEFAV